jgi:DNA-binding CsgD family transcriptional regulator
VKRQSLKGYRLSEREKEILRLLAGGNRPKEIAGTLKLCLKTIQSYCGRLKQKLGSQNTLQPVRHAVLLCHAQTTDYFDTSLNRVASIEIRYLDVRGELIALRKFMAQ